MLYLCTETYNNEQVSKFVKQNFSINMSKMDYFGSKSQKFPSAGGCLKPSTVP